MPNASNTAISALSTLTIGTAVFKLLQNLISLKKLHQKPTVLIGPSGVGKGTLNKLLNQRFPNRFATCVSHTTRKPRKGEVDGIHYHFVSKEQMKNDIENGLFIEWANVFGNLYGTSIKAIQAINQQNKICILEIDIQGAETLYNRDDIECNFVFIHPPNGIASLKERLYKRNTETDDVIDKRLETAKYELERSRKCSFITNHIVNDDLDQAFHELTAYMLQKYPRLI